MVLVTLGSNLDDWLARTGGGLSKVLGSLRKLYVSIVFLFSVFLIPTLSCPFSVSVLFVPGGTPFFHFSLSNILIPRWVSLRGPRHPSPDSREPRRGRREMVVATYL